MLKAWEVLEQEEEMITGHNNDDHLNNKTRCIISDQSCYVSI